MFARISRPIREKSSCTSGLLNVDAMSVPFGRLNAFVPVSRRIPDGPSEQQPQGTPKFLRLSETPPNAAAVPGVTFGEHIPSPRTRQLRSAHEAVEVGVGKLSDELVEGAFAALYICELKALIARESYLLGDKLFASGIFVYL